MHRHRRAPGPDDAAGRPESSRAGAWAPLLAELQQRLREVTSGLGRPPREQAGDPARRRPRAEIDRWVRVRDRHCVAPGCRRPAHKADLDHTVDHALGGPTSPWNLGVWDRHHHRAKHHGGWRVRQPAPGRFEIRTRAGVRHTTLPKRILEPLPPPRPSTRPRPLPDEGWSEDDPGWRQRFLRRAGLGTITHTPAIPPAVHAADDPPPF
ncbi:HNH endonuclease signature motif containing protein [Actinomycetospora sp. NBC_00405]|uniref:HNH endonuclease signature motif containing protein n=1 Tax=Actinomycetospora sp. NBC_00405 TaxID=2975952 RepID=UPI002E1DA381